MGLDGYPYVTYMGFSNLSMINVLGGENGSIYPLYNGNQTYFTLKDVSFDIPNVAGAELGFWGTKVIQGTVSMVGKSGTLFMVNKPLIIDPGSTLYVGPTLELLFDLANPNITFADTNSTLYLDNCILVRSNASQHASWSFLVGRMLINGQVNLEIVPGNQPLVIGDGTVADNFNIEILPGSTFGIGSAVNTAALVLQNTN
jgi:hypothetical protein